MSRSALLQIDWLDSPIGTIVLVVDDGQLCALEFADNPARLDAFLQRRYPLHQLAATRDPYGFSGRIAAYLAGDYAAIDAIPVKASGTPFQHQVWQALRRIPPGQMRRYGQLAAELGRPRAARAVGLANSQNPVSIVVPCHRLVGVRGALTGYAGGLTRKQWLLAHERASQPPNDSRAAPL